MMNSTTNSNYNNTNYYDPRNNTNYAGSPMPDWRASNTCTYQYLNQCPYQPPTPLYNMNNPYPPEMMNNTSNFYNTMQRLNNEAQAKGLVPPNPIPTAPEPPKNNSSNNNEISTAQIQEVLNKMQDKITTYYFNPANIIKGLSDKFVSDNPLYCNDEYGSAIDWPITIKPGTISHHPSDKIYDGKQIINVYKELRENLILEKDQKGHVTKFKSNNPMDNDLSKSKNPENPTYNFDNSTIYNVSYDDNDRITNINSTDGYNYEATYDDNGRFTGYNASGKSALYIDQDLVIDGLQNDLTQLIPSVPVLLRSMDDRYTNAITDQNCSVEYSDTSDELSNIKIETTKRFKNAGNTYNSAYDITSKETLEFNRPTSTATEDNPWEINFSIRYYDSLHDETGVKRECLSKINSLNSFI